MSFHHNGMVLSPEVQELDVDISISDLAEQLSSETRWWNCIVVAESFNETYGLDASEIHRNVMGCANTFFIPATLEDEFSDAVGFDFRVFGGGARSFRPGFNPVSSEITAHPVIKAPYAASNYGTSRASHILCSDAFRSSVEREDIRHLAPSFATIKQLSTQQESEVARETGDSSVQISALEELVTAEKKNSEEAVSLAIQFDEERQIAQAELENEKAINYGLKLRIDALENGLKNVGAETETKEPTEYGEVKDWVAKNFSGKLRLAPRAEKTLKDARYEKIQDVISGLRLLAGSYRDLKRGELRPNEFDSKCSGLGFEETKSISKSSAGKQGDEYFVLYAGRKQFMERHLKKGTSKDLRFCLRIYYFWDEVNELVVVGSLPEHLNTTAT